jgi:hypothetical protein
MCERYVRFLVDHSANVNMPFNIFEKALSYKHVSVARILLKHGATTEDQSFLNRILRELILPMGEGENPENYQRRLELYHLLIEYRFKIEPDQDITESKEAT